MQHTQKENNQNFSNQSKKSEKMENSRPISFPQNFEGAGRENPERDGDSMNLPVKSENVKVIKEEDSVRSEKDEGEHVNAAIAVDDCQDVKIKEEEGIVRAEKQDDELGNAKLKCGLVGNSMKIQGDLNLTINCSDFKVNSENEKNVEEEDLKAYSVIWISAPTKENAVDVATLLLTEKLVTSVNILDGVTTMLLKEGNIKTLNEVVVKMKTETSLVSEIISVTDNHFRNKLSIHDAEILSTTLRDGNLAYFRYVSENTKDSPPRAPLREEQDNNLVLPSKQEELREHVVQKNVEMSGQFKLESNT
jgi:uncharacterized protein involved in tolerance to divalent cations